MKPSCIINNLLLLKLLLFLSFFNNKGNLLRFEAKIYTHFEHQLNIVLADHFRFSPNAM